jgi:hypothetical protein
MAENHPLPTAEKSTPFPSIADDSSMRAVVQSQATDRAHLDRQNFGRRRSISGNIQSRLPFLCTTTSSDRTSLERINDNDDSTPLSGGSVVQGQESGRTRKRKGSLSKTALVAEPFRNLVEMRNGEEYERQSNFAKEYG